MKFKPSFTVLRCYIDFSLNLVSNFVTNSYGESSDSSCEQIMSPNPEPLSPSSKNNKSYIENAWAFMWPDR